MLEDQQKEFNLRFRIATGMAVGFFVMNFIFLGVGVVAQPPLASQAEKFTNVLLLWSLMPIGVAVVLRKKFNERVKRETEFSKKLALLLQGTIVVFGVIESISSIGLIFVIQGLPNARVLQYFLAGVVLLAFSIFFPRRAAWESLLSE